MNVLRHLALRVPTVMLAAFGWLAISNHCAIGTLNPPTKTPMSCHGLPSDNHAPVQPGNSGEVACCKTLRATLLTSAKSLISVDESVFAAHKYFVALLVPPDAAQKNATFGWDTGPPGADSFAETVLQRSILAHAPPSLA